ncbi:MAG: hydrogenase maturation protease [Bacteroidota bacterium]
MSSTTLIIGIGNELRGDDAAGPVAARLLRTRVPEADVLEVHQLTADLATSLSTYDTVVFIDADERTDRATLTPVLTRARTGAVHAHHMTPQDLLLLAEALGDRVPLRSIQAAIPARSFDHGTDLSSTSQKGVAECVDAVCALLRVEVAAA